MYNALIRACEKCHQYEKALELFVEMQERHLEPDVITCNALISAGEKCHQYEKALEFFPKMQERHLESDVITYNALISACEKCHQYEKAFELFVEMQGRHLEPNVITYSALISAWEKCHQHGKAFELFAEPIGKYCGQQLKEFDGKKLRSTTKEGLSLEDEDEKNKLEELKAEPEPLAKRVKEVPGEEVEKGIMNSRMADSPSVLMAGAQHAGSAGGGGGASEGAQREHAGTAGGARGASVGAQRAHASIARGGGGAAAGAQTAGGGGGMCSLGTLQLGHLAAWTLCSLGALQLGLVAAWALCRVGKEEVYKDTLMSDESKWQGEAGEGIIIIGRRWVGWAGGQKEETLTGASQMRVA